MKQFVLFSLLIALLFSFNVVIAQDDEFKPLNQNEQSSSVDNGEDEFKPIEEDEFKPLGDDTSSASCSQTCSSSCSQTCPHAQEMQAEEAEMRKLWWILAALGATIIAGILVRFSITRKLRSLFLLSSMLVFGFYVGGCPCIVSSYEFTFLSIFGYSAKWVDALWFLGLIPITYLFGKVWCGWICHLGAVQEFLYRPNVFKFLRNEMALKTMRIIRYTLMVALIIQLGVMGSIYWCKIDPFLAIFNLQLNYDHEWTSGILLGLLLLMSLFTYRPFCKSVCPIGITLGWISHIPGASVIGISGKCAGCKVCDSSCDIDAIYRKNKVSYLDNKECIMCGDCIQHCPQGGLTTMRKKKNNPVKVVCTKACEIKNSN